MWIVAEFDGASFLILSRSKVWCDDFVVRHLQLKRGKEERNIKHNVVKLKGLLCYLHRALSIINLVVWIIIFDYFLFSNMNPRLCPQIRLQNRIENKAAITLQCKWNIRLIAALLFIPYSFPLWGYCHQNHDMLKVVGSTPNFYLTPSLFLSIPLPQEHYMHMVIFSH